MPERQLGSGRISRGRGAHRIMHVGELGLDHDQEAPAQLDGMLLLKAGHESPRGA